MMNKYIVIVGFWAVTISQVLGNDYEDCIVTTTKTEGETIRIYPGTPYDYVEKNQSSIQYRYLGLGSADTNLVSSVIDYHRKFMYFYDTNSIKLYRLSNFEPKAEPGITYYIDVAHEGISSSMYTRIALDWLVGNIYWTDPVYKWIALQNGETNEGYKILFHEDLTWPLAIAVDPVSRYLFWSDVGPVVKIERSSLNGVDRTAIITTGLVRPTSISIDYTDNKIVFIDEGRDTLEIANFNGEQRRVIRRLSHTSFFDVAVFRDYIMVTDRYKSLTIVNKNTGAIIPINFGSDFLSVKMYSADTQDNSTENTCENSECEHICVNTISGPVCLCYEGYTQSGNTCTEDTGSYHRAFIQSNATHVCLMDVRKLLSKHVDVFKCIVSDGTDIRHIDVETASRNLIMADGDTIYSTNIDGTNVKNKILTATSKITGLAVDWRDSNIYWTNDEGVHLVTQTSPQTSYVLIENSITSPHDLIVVPFQNLMFWISGTSGNYKIEKAGLDGSSRVTIVTSGSIISPVSLTIDRDTELLYFIDGVLKRCNVNGSDFLSVTSAADYPPYSVLVYKNHLTLAKKGYPKDTLSTYDLKLGTLLVGQEDEVLSMTDMEILDSSLQPSSSGACDIMNGDCEQICLPIGSNRLCRCDFGFQLEVDRRSCSSEHITDNFLIVTDWTHNKMYQVSLKTNDVRAVDTHTVGSPVGVLYDTNSERVIWSINGYLLSCHINGENKTVIQDTKEMGCLFDRLAIDPTSGNIYFTVLSVSELCTHVGVGVIKTSGDYKILISDGEQPRAIVLDPEDGLLFWTDHGAEPPFVKKANMDGTDVEVVKDTDLGWPNGLAIDTEANKLYVTDGKYNKIYRCAYTGFCVVYYEEPGAHLMDILLIGDYLYYTAWNRPFIIKLNKLQTTDKSILAQNAELGRLDSMTYYSSESTQPVSSACSTNDGLGPCSTFCLPTPSGYSCRCEEGVNLRSDGKTCENVPLTTTSTTTTPTTTSTTTSTSTSTSTSTTTSATTSTSPSTPRMSRQDSPAIAISLAGVGLILVVIAVVATLYFFKRRQRHKLNDNQHSDLREFDIATVCSRKHDEVHYKRDTTYDLIIFDKEHIADNKCEGASTSNRTQSCNDYVDMRNKLSGAYESLMDLPPASSLPVSASEGRNSDYLEPTPAVTSLQNSSHLSNPMYDDSPSPPWLPEEI